MDEVGRTLSWGALGSFLNSAKPDSAIIAETHPEIAEWSSVFKTNVILADIYDALTWFNATVMAKGTGKRPNRPKEYYRSWRKKNSSHGQFKKVMKISDWLKMIGGEKKDG